MRLPFRGVHIPSRLGQASGIALRFQGGQPQLIFPWFLMPVEDARARGSLRHPVLRNHDICSYPATGACIWLAWPVLDINRPLLVSRVNDLLQSFLLLSHSTLWPRNWFRRQVRWHMDSIWSTLAARFPSDDFQDARLSPFRSPLVFRCWYRKFEWQSRLLFGISWCWFRDRRHRYSTTWSVSHPDQYF